MEVSQSVADRSSGNLQRGHDQILPPPDFNGCKGHIIPAGDCFVVYPDSDGTPLESIRLMTLEEAMQDIRAMRLAEELYSHEEVVREIEKVLSDELSFTRCAHSSREMLRVREAINEMIKKKI